MSLRPPHPSGVRIERRKRDFPPSTWWRWECLSCGEMETGFRDELRAIESYGTHRMTCAAPARLEAS